VNRCLTHTCKQMHMKDKRPYREKTYREHEETKLETYYHNIFIGSLQFAHVFILSCAFKTCKIVVSKGEVGVRVYQTTHLQPQHSVISINTG